MNARTKLTALRSFMVRHQPSAFSGESPFPVVEQMMMSKDARSFRGIFFTAFNDSHLLLIPCSDSLPASSTARLSAFPV
jgi:hypothetical protein